MARTTATTATTATSTATPPTSAANSTASPTANNVAVLRGTVSSAPTARDLPDGCVVVQFDVATVIDVDGRPVRAAVPAAWYDPPGSWADVLAADREVLVVGAVQRRFFRVGGATQSRTEVRVRRVVPARRRRDVARTLEETTQALLAS
mgnify:CR=1 FL=1